MSQQIPPLQPPNVQMFLTSGMNPIWRTFWVQLLSFLSANMTNLGSYATDAAAAAAGVPLQGWYLNSVTGAVTSRRV